MKYIKKILPLLLVLLLLTGCTSEPMAEITPTPSPSPTAEPTPTPTPTPSPTPSPTPTPTPTLTPTPTPTPIPEPENLFDPYFDSYTIEEKLDVLRERFPAGMYWNHSGIDNSEMSHDEAALLCTDIPCDHSNYGYGPCNIYNGETMHWFGYGYNMECLGFASLISDFLFGKEAEIREYWSFDEVRVGDHIRLDLWDHSFIVSEVGVNEEGEDYIKIVECNRNFEDCLIEWDRVLTRSDIYSYGNYVTYLTRYPLEEVSAEIEE